MRENMHGYWRFSATADKIAKNAGVEIERSIEVQLGENTSNLRRHIVNMNYVNMPSFDAVSFSECLLHKAVPVGCRGVQARRSPRLD
jgi:hypothetical protein